MADTTIGVDLTTETDTIVRDEVILTFADILEMFSDIGVDINGVTLVSLVVKTKNGRFNTKVLNADNELQFRIRKKTTA